MQHEDFSVGCEFLCGEKRWRCTDVGTRIVAAVCLSDHADDPSWYNGPPYAVAETVFDEYDFDACRPATPDAPTNGGPQIQAYARRRDRELTTDALVDLVSLRHLDGSLLLLCHARLEQLGEWLVVFAEHHQPQVFHRDDLRGWLSVPMHADAPPDQRGWHYQVYHDADGERRIHEDYRDDDGAWRCRTAEPVAPAGATHDELIDDLCYMLLDATLHPAKPLDNAPGTPPAP